MNIEALAVQAGMSSYHAKGHYFKQSMNRFAHLIREAVVQELMAGSGEPQKIEQTDQYGDAYGYTADQLAGAVARERERIAELEAELMEQSRVNGMGSEREAALIARVERLEAVVDVALEALEERSGVFPGSWSMQADKAVAKLKEVRK